MIICSTCRAKNPSGAQVCAACGQDLEARLKSVRQRGEDPGAVTGGASPAAPAADEQAPSLDELSWGDSAILEPIADEEVAAAEEPPILEPIADDGTPLLEPIAEEGAPLLEPIAEEGAAGSAPAAAVEVVEVPAPEAPLRVPELEGFDTADLAKEEAPAAAAPLLLPDIDGTSEAEVLDEPPPVHSSMTPVAEPTPEPLELPEVPLPPPRASEAVEQVPGHAQKESEPPAIAEVPLPPAAGLPPEAQTQPTPAPRPAPEAEWAALPAAAVSDGEEPDTAAPPGMMSEAEMTADVMSSAEMTADQALADDAMLQRDSEGQSWLDGDGIGGGELEIDAPGTVGRHHQRGDPNTIMDRLQALPPGCLMIGSPPLPEFPILPELVKELQLKDGGLKHSVIYAWESRSVVKTQRVNVKTLGAELARLKRQERGCLRAIGRGARKHELVPAEYADLAETADQVDANAEVRNRDADQTVAEHARAEEEYDAARAAGEERLQQLEARQAPLAARFREMDRRRAALLAKLNDLRPHEQELRVLAESEPSLEEVGGEIEVIDDRIVIKERNPEEVKQARLKEHAACCAALREAEAELGGLQARIDKVKKPLDRIAEELAGVKAGVEKKRDAALAVQGEAEVAALAGKRRRAFADRSTAELDEEIGQVLLYEKMPHPSLNQLIRGLDKCRRRVEKVEDLLNRQQDALDLFNPTTARTGWTLIIGGAVAAAAVITLGVFAYQHFAG